MDDALIPATIAAGRTHGIIEEHPVTRTEPWMPTNIAFEKHTLSNGLDVIMHVDRSIPVAAVNVWYHVGSQNEEPDRTGFAHLFEHIMFKGSKHHNREYFMPLQEVGASINGSTTTDRTNYYEDVPAEYLELALWLESDRMGFLLDAFDQHSFDTEVDVVRNERRQSYENRPYGLAGQEIRKALFPPNHPYHWQTIGSHEHLEAATLEDVKDFFRRFYAPNNASLSIAGDIDIEETKRLVESYFGDLPPAPPVAAPAALDAAARRRGAPGAGGQRSAARASTSPGWDRRASTRTKPPLDVLMAILGEGRSSRLYRSLVYEKQIARAASAYYAAMEIAGEIRVDATLAPGATLQDVESGAAGRDRRGCRAQPPTARRGAARRQRPRGALRPPARVRRRLRRPCRPAELLQRLHRRPRRLNTDFDRYQAVTPADVQRVAQKYLTRGPRASGGQPEGAGRAGSRSRSTASCSPDQASPHASSRRRRSASRSPAGIDLLVVEKHEVPLVAAGVYFPGGAVLDPADRAGPGVLHRPPARSKGTKTRSSTQIADESDFIAAHPNVGVDRENVDRLDRGADAALAARAGAASRRGRSTRPSLKPRSSACAASASPTCAG